MKKKIICIVSLGILIFVLGISVPAHAASWRVIGNNGVYLIIQSPNGATKTWIKIDGHDPSTIILDEKGFVGWGDDITNDPAPNIVTRSPAPDNIYRVGYADILAASNHFMRDSSNGSGTWVSVYGAKFDSINYGGIIVGLDRKLSRRLSIGALISHGKADSSQGDLESIVGGLYAIYALPNSLSVDALVRYQKIEEGSNKYDGVGAVIGLNKTFSLVNNFYVIQRLQYGHQDYGLNKSSLVSAHIALGRKIKSHDIYIKAAAFHELQYTDFKGTWFEYGIGASSQLTNRQTLNIELERSHNAKFKKELSGIIRYTINL